MAVLAPVALARDSAIDSYRDSAVDQVRVRAMAFSLPGSSMRATGGYSIPVVIVLLAMALIFALVSVARHGTRFFLSFFQIVQRS